MHEFQCNFAYNHTNSVSPLFEAQQPGISSGNWSIGNIKVFPMQKDILFSHTSSLYCITIEKFDNQFDKFDIEILQGEEMVGH